MEYKDYTATIHFDAIVVDVYDCLSKKEAEEKAKEIAEDLASCHRSIEPNISVDKIEVD